MELRCSRDLALRLGAAEPVDIAQHKRIRDSGIFLLMRDQDGNALFWKWATTVPESMRRST